jgi:hypothetical protein
MSNDATTRYKDAYSIGLVNIAGDSYFALFNANNAVSSNSTVWNAARPDAVNVTLGSNPAINENGSEFALWVWSDSAFYRNIEFWGNGSTDGPFVHLGGRLRGVIASKGAGNSAWAWGNSVVDETNPLTNGGISPDYSDVFAPATYGAITSMGYKLITSAATYNTNAWAFFGVAVVDQVKYRNAF